MELKKTILVTGATGALGRSLTSYLRRNKYIKIIAISKKNTVENSYVVDILNEAEVTEAIATHKPDLIFHLAATFVHDLNLSIKVNLLTSVSILEAIKKQNLPIRLVLIGSAAEYGIVTEDENPICEDHNLAPVSIYGLTKSWQSDLVNYYACNGVDVVLARIFNLMGDNISSQLLVGRLMNQIAQFKRNERTHIELGPLNAIRDYISLEDACEQLLLIANKGSSGQIYHVASGKPILMRDLVLKFLKTHGISTSKLIEAEHLTNHSGIDVPIMYANTSKTMNLFNKK